MADWKWNKLQKLRIKTTSPPGEASSEQKAVLGHARRFVVDRWAHAKEVRRQIALWLVGVGVLIAGAAAQFAWFQASYSTEGTADGGTYAEGVLGNLGNLNPIYATTPAELSASRLVFSALFDYDKSGSLREDLASGVTVQDEGKKYTVSLRDGLKWHDGTKLTARDVVFTVNLLKNPAIGYAQNASWTDVEASAKDERTVTFTLPSPYAPFPSALTFAILPAHILEKADVHRLQENQFSVKPIGSGPFKFRYMQSVGEKDENRKVLHLERNAQYYRGAPKLERWQLHTYKDQGALREGLLSKEVNAASGLPQSDSSSQDEGRAKGIVTKSIPTNSGVYAVFNMKRDVLKQEDMRRALQLAIDTDQVRKSLGQPVQPLTIPFVGGQVQGATQPPRYNKSRAQAIFDSLGWKQNYDADGIRYKKGTPLKLRLASIKDADYDRVASNIIAQWKAVGVAVEYVQYDANDPAQNIASSLLRPRDYDVLLYELMIGADPDVYAYWHSSQASARGLNFANFSDPVADDALASARSRIEPELRSAKYRTFVDRWVKQVPAIGLYQSNAVYATRDYTKTIDDNTRFVSQYDRYADVQTWTVRRETVYKTP